MIDALTKPKSQSWLSEPKNVATTLVGLALATAAGYAFLTYVLPWLLTVTWNLVHLIAAGAVLAFLLLLVTNAKFWRALKYFSEFVANYTIGLAIELNPFAILQARIDQGYADRNTLYKQTVKLKGKHNELHQKLREKDSEMQLNIGKVKVLQAEGAPARQLDLYANNVLRCHEYIDSVTPIVGDLGKLIAFADGAYEESGIMLEDAKLDLEAKKDLYYSVTTGMSAVSSALRAFKGDDQLNQDADRALALLKTQINEKIGHIKSAIDLTSKFMDDRVLEDKVKASQVLELINGFDAKKDFHYSQHSLDKNKEAGHLKDIHIKDRYRGLLD